MKPRISIAALIGLIAFCGVGFAGLKEPTEVLASAGFTFVVGLALAASLAARRQGACLGFALFAWAYIALAFGPWPSNRTRMPPLLPGVLADAAMDCIQGGKPYLAFEDFPDRPIMISRNSPPLNKTPPNPRGVFLVYYRQVSHCLGAVAFGTIGAVLGRVLPRRKPAG